VQGKAIWAGAIARVLVQVPGVRDLQHVRTLHVREPGELGSGWQEVVLPVRLGKAGGRNPSKSAAEQSDRSIVPEKPSNKGPSILMESGPRTGGDGGGKGPDQGEPG